MYKQILLGAALALFTSTAMAADVTYEEPAPVEEAVPVSSWTGVYVGISGGGGWLNGDFSAGGASVSDDFDGARFSGFVGYNHQFDNNFVLGVEGDVGYNWNENTYLGAVDVGTDLDGSVRGRLGYAVDSNVLVYGTAGWAFTNAYLDAPGFSEEETFHGWTVGAGVDWAVTEKLFVRGEYRYNDFSDKDILGINADLDQHVLSIGVGVKF